jgi:copper oxidase (laccase) domain-containing protein
LPLADCIGAVLYDPDTSVLMVSHLGRHNVEQGGGSKSVQYLVKNHDVNPKNLKVWLSPAAGKTNYPLHAFDNRGLHEIATEQLITAGIVPENIDTSRIDTTTDTTYFSHSEFLKGHRDTDGRFAVVAVMRD